MLHTPASEVERVQVELGRRSDTEDGGVRETERADVGQVDEQVRRVSWNQVRPVAVRDEVQGKVRQLRASLTDKVEVDVVRSSGEPGKVLVLELTVVTEVEELEIDPETAPLSRGARSPRRSEGCRSLCPTRHSEVKADGSKTVQTQGARELRSRSVVAPARSPQKVMWRRWS